MSKSQIFSSVTIRDSLFRLYGDHNNMLSQQTERYTRLMQRHTQAFGARDTMIFVSAPGRIEICGNHTDHNRGKVLAAAIHLDALAAVHPRDDDIVVMHSEGYPPMTLNLNTLSPIDEEIGTSASLVRGVAKRMADMGFQIGGFEATVHSTVFSGSGISSSAAFEVMICAIFDALYNSQTMDAVMRAKISQYAENVYFGKPSGLMDQMASSVGGLISIDFAGNEPIIDMLTYDFSAKGYAIAVVNTGGSHVDLTDDYAAIPAEMHAVAEYFGQSVLSEVSCKTFFQSIPALRKNLSITTRDRAILRAKHFFDENSRVTAMLKALRSDDLQSFLSGVIASGRSSMELLQNIYAKPDSQSLTLALMIAEQLLAGKGAWRIHGGGFAGTTLNFVPVDLLDDFILEMDAVFGARATAILAIRKQGAAVFSPFKKN